MYGSNNHIRADTLHCLDRWDEVSVRALPLVERKKLLRAVVPDQSSVILFAHHVHGRGRDLFPEVCRQDLEGIVAKHSAERYGEDEPKRWLKIKNPENSQARDRAKLFER